MTPAEAAALLAAAEATGTAEAFVPAVRAFRAAGRLADAVTAARRATELATADAAAWSRLGLQLADAGDFVAAEAAQRRAVALDPMDARWHNNLGNVLARRRRRREAIACFRRAIEIAPGHVRAWSNLGVTLTDDDRPAEAVAALERAVALEPGRADSHGNLGIPLMRLGRLAEARAAFERALALDPAARGVAGNLLFCLTYDSAAAPDAALPVARAWGRRAEAAAAAFRAPHANVRDPGRRLRIGYVSPDMRRHSVAYFLEPVLAAHEREAVELYAYAEVDRPDGVTARLRGLVDHWRPTAGRSDAAVIATVRNDRIDILVDLAGHTAGNRLGVFAAKPAPVQVTWLGFPTTTGLGAFDWRLTDAVTDPDGRDDVRHSERLWRLPGCFLAYRPPEDAPPPAPCPSMEAGRITFGSFNNLPKLSNATLDLWARLLAAVPQARLLVKTGQLGDAGTAAAFRARAAAAGLPPDRLDLVGWIAGTAGHLDAYGRVDVALDSAPYNGTTTTCEALWMGVPVVTLAGDRHAGRVGTSLLGAAGLDGLVARTAADYVRIAAALADAPERRADLRRTLRDRVAASPLGDADGFTRRLEAAYRAMWRRCCMDG